MACSSYFSSPAVIFEQLTQSRLHRNLHTIELDDLSLRTLTSDTATRGAFVLDQLQTLPNITQMLVTADREVLPLIVSHPLWLRMRSIELCFAWTPSDLECQQVGVALSRCAQLRRLRLGTSSRLLILLSSAALRQLLSSLDSDQLEWFSTRNSEFELRLPTECLTRLTSFARLHTLLVKLTIQQVEVMCDQAATGRWDALHTLELQLTELQYFGSEAIDHAALEQAAALFHLDPSSPQLTLYRLSCLAGLPTLRHLRIRTDHCLAGDAMLPLRVAQRRDAKAFVQLQSYELAMDGCYEATNLATAATTPQADGQALDVTAAAARPVSFPCLTSLRLGCCSPSWLSAESRELAQLCAEASNVRDLSLEVHVFVPSSPVISRPIVDMHSGSLAWCRPPGALGSLKSLTALTIDRPFWSAEHVTISMIRDLHALAQQHTELTFLNVLRVCTLFNRDEIEGLMQLKLRNTQEP